MICRSALHDTPMPTGSDAPCRGSRITRTSWQKYLPPNCAPMPMVRVSSSTFCSISRSRNAWPALLPAGRQRVQPAGGGQLHRLHRRFRRRAADDDRQVIRRAGGGAERLDLGFQELQQLARGQNRAGLLEQEALVGRPAALGDEHQGKLVGVVLARRGQDVELHRQVVAGVDLLEHASAAPSASSAGWSRCRCGARPRPAPPPRRRPPRRAGPSCRTRWRCRCPGTSAARRRRRCWRSSAGPARRSGRSRDASGSSRMARNCARWPGRSRCDTSWNAWNASSLSASGAMRSTVCPSQVAVRTPAIGSFFHTVRSGPSGNIGA